MPATRCSGRFPIEWWVRPRRRICEKIPQPDRGSILWSGFRCPPPNARRETVRRKAAIIGDRILVEADFFAKLFGVQRPAFDIGIEAKTVQPKLWQPGELLLHGKLHVMPGDSFVIGDGFVVDQRTLGEIRSGHDDAAGAFAVRRAGDVVGGRRGLKGWYRFHGYRRLGEQSEQLREALVPFARCNGGNRRGSGPRKWGCIWDWFSVKRGKRQDRRSLLFLRWRSFLFRCGRFREGPVGEFHRATCAW